MPTTGWALLRWEISPPSAIALQPCDADKDGRCGVAMHALQEVTYHHQQRAYSTGSPGTPAGWAPFLQHCQPGPSDGASRATAVFSLGPTWACRRQDEHPPIKALQPMGRELLSRLATAPAALAAPCQCSGRRLLLDIVFHAFGDPQERAI